MQVMSMPSDDLPIGDGIDAISNQLLTNMLPKYYQPAIDKISLTPSSDYISLNYGDLKDNYTQNIGRVDELVSNVGIGEDELFARQYGLLSKSGNDLKEVGRSLTNDAFGRLDDNSVLNDLADYEVLRSLNSIPMYPAALLAGGIGGSLAGLDPLQSLATGAAATAAIPLTDAVLNNNPSLRKYKATMGVRPAAAALTGILTALGLKTFSPEQEQQLLNQGMQYANPQPIQYQG